MWCVCGDSPNGQVNVPGSEVTSHSIILFASSLSSSWCSCGGVVPPSSGLQCSNTLPLTPPPPTKTHTNIHTKRSLLGNTLRPNSPYSGHPRPSNRHGHEGIWTEWLEEWRKRAGDGLLKIPWGRKEGARAGAQLFASRLSDRCLRPAHLGTKDISILLFSHFVW